MALATPEDYAARYGTAGTEPDRLAVLLDDASSLLEKVAGRPLEPATDADVTVDAYGGPTLFLAGTPILDVNSVVADGSTLAENTDFEWWRHGELTHLSGGWPNKPHSVTVTYSYGEGPPAWLVSLACTMVNRALRASGRGEVASESFGAGEYAVSFRGAAGLVGLAIDEEKEVCAYGAGAAIV